MQETIETTPTITSALAEYQPTAAALADLRQRFAGIAFDLTTTKGDKEARAARLELVRLRTTLEAKRKELKAPALERSRLIDDEARRITGAILELETPIDEQIRAAEAKKEQERQARVEAERQRVAALQDRIDQIKAVAARAVGKPAAEIEAKIKLIVAMEIGADFQELAPAAAQAQADTLATLRDLHARAVEQEAEAERIKAERAELERLRAEAAERERIERERVAAEQAAEAARLAQERAKLEAEQAAARAEHRRLAEAAEAERRAADAKAAAERAEADRIANEARAAEQRRIDAERAELKRQQDEARAAQLREAERLAEVERARQAAEAAACTRLQASAQALLDALVLAVPYVANHGTADDLAQCNAAIAAATGGTL
jgi:IgA-specific serine endopeptidase